MIFRSLASLRVAVPFAALLVLSACSDNRQAQLSQVEVVDDVPTVETGPQRNLNLASPALVIPDTFPVSEGDELTLVFSEEFDGPEIDPAVWFFATGDGTEVGLPGGWGNNERQYYLPDNAMIVNGVLEITARRETFGDFNYTSARINTEDRFAFKYGRIEASIKMPSGQGLWPAFWMLSQDSDYQCGGEPCVWAAIGEIDIVEAINLDGTNGNEIFATIHYGGEFPGNQSTSVTYTPSVDVTESFNTYALEWDENEIRWYFNGQLYAMQNSWNSSADGKDFPAPFDQNFHILLNLAVGGNFPGSPNGTTPWPATMEVDWVRVYSGEAPDGGAAATEPNVAAPTPTEDAAGVISLFSDAYDDITDINYNPDWGQATVFTEAGIAGNKMLKYANLDYQGIDFEANPQDVSDKGYLHLDVWTADSTELNVYLISPGAETPYAVPVAANSWVSVDIPLTEFAGVDLTNLIQLKFDGNGTIFLDNLYFAGDAPPPDPAMGGEVPSAVIIAADGSTPDLVAGTDFTGFEAFGTGGSNDYAFAGDSSYGNVVAVTPGGGYGGGSLGQFGIVGFTPGFATAYDALLFKVKGLADNTVVAKLEEPFPGASVAVTIDLTAPPAGVTVTDLGDGWSQVVISIANFGDVSTFSQVVIESVPGSQAEGSAFYVTDVGFNSAVAMGGEVPSAGIIAADGSTPDLVAGTDFTGFEAFGTGGSNDYAFAGDSSYGNVVAVTPGGGYGGGSLGQFGIVGFTPGFATAYDALLFKVKGLAANTVVVKLEEPFPGASVAVTVDLTSPPAGVTVTDLGDGWSQVVIPIANFGDVSTFSQVVIESVPGSQAEGSAFYVTDVGFNSAGGGGDPFDSGLLTNGDFEAGVSPWLAGVTDPIGADNVIDDGGNNVYFVNVAAAGPAFTVNLSQKLTITPDETYTLTFKAKSNVARTMLAGIGLSDGDFANVTQSVDLTTEWQTFTLELTAAGFGDANSRVLFDMGAEIGEVYIDDVSLVVSGGGGDPFDSGLLTNGDFEAGVSPWLAGVTDPIGADNVIDDGGNNVYFVNVAAAGPAFTVNLSQKLTITPDETYTLTFKAKSNVARTMLAGIGLSDGDFANTVQSVDLTTEWQTFTLELTAAGFGDANSRVLFDMGAEIGEVYIDDVSLVVSGGGGDPFDSGLLTNGDFEAGVSPWLAGVTDPIGADNVIDDGGNNVYFVNVAAAGPAFTVNLSQKLTITPDETYTLTFKAKSNVARTMLAGIGLSDGDFANTVQSVDLTTEWQTFTLELTAAGFGDANSRVLFDMGAEIGEVFIDDVSLVVSTGGGGSGGGGGELAVNGDFETGNFDDWEQFVNSGLQSISGDTPTDGGSFSAALSGNTAVGAGGTTEIKQANLGSGGALSVGDVLTIRFQVKGTFGPGGQLNVLSFTEIGGGGADLSNNTIISGGVDDWTQYNYDVTLSGGDASGGFSLAFNPVCGAVPDCVADVFIDNVSITTN